MTSDEAFGFLFEEIRNKKVQLQNKGTELFGAGKYDQISPVTQQIEDVGILIHELIIIRKHWGLVFSNQKINDLPLSKQKKPNKNRVLPSTHNIYQSEFRTKMVISPEEALIYIKRINHELCQRAVSTNWITNQSGYARAQSILWLYCWAYPGTSTKTAEHADTFFWFVWINILFFYY